MGIRSVKVASEYKGSDCIKNARVMIRCAEVLQDYDRRIVASGVWTIGVDCRLNLEPSEVTRLGSQTIHIGGQRFRPTEGSRLEVIRRIHGQELTEELEEGELFDRNFGGREVPPLESRRRPGIELDEEEGAGRG